MRTVPGEHSRISECTVDWVTEKCVSIYNGNERFTRTTRTAVEANFMYIPFLDFIQLVVLDDNLLLGRSMSQQ
jgi:hypothetical protein